MHDLEKLAVFPLVVLDYSLPKDMNIHVQTSEISIQNFQINSYHVPRERDFNGSEWSNFISDIFL